MQSAKYAGRKRECERACPRRIGTLVHTRVSARSFELVAQVLSHTLVGFDTAVHDRDHAMGTSRDVALVCDDDDRVAFFMKPFKEVHDLHAGLGVECSGWLVSQKNRRVIDKRPCDRNALTLAAGKLVRPMRYAVAEFDRCQRSLGIVVTLGGTDAGVYQRKLDIVLGGRPRKEIKGLKDKTDLFVANAGKLVVGHVGNQMAVDPVVAL